MGYMCEVILPHRVPVALLWSLWPCSYINGVFSSLLEHFSGGGGDDAVPAGRDDGERRARVKARRVGVI